MPSDADKYIQQPWPWHRTAVKVSEIPEEARHGLREMAPESVTVNDIELKFELNQIKLKSYLASLESLAGLIRRALGCSVEGEFGEVELATVKGITNDSQ